MVLWQAAYNLFLGLALTLISLVAQENWQPAAPLPLATVLYLGPAVPIRENSNSCALSSADF